MADMMMVVDTALAEVPVNLMPLLDDTDMKSRETAIAYNAAGMDLVWNFVTTGGAYTQTAVTPTTAGTYDWAHQGDGMYSIEIPASGGASINNDTEGYGWFTGFCTGVLPWRGPVIQFSPANVVDALVNGSDKLQVHADEMTAGLITATVIATGAIDADAIADNAIDAGAIAANAITSAKIATGAITSGTFAAGAINAAAIAADAITDAKVASDVTIASVTGAVGSVSGAVGSVTGNVGGNVVGTVASVVGAVGSVTGNVGGNVTGSAGSIASGGITTASFAAGAINAAAIAADAITDAKVAADVTIASVTGAVGSVTAGVTVTTNNDKTGYRLSATGVDDVLDEVVEGSITFRQMLRLFGAALGGELSGAATTTIVIRNASDSKTVITATVDSDGNRSAMTLDLT